MCHVASRRPYNNRDPCLPLRTGPCPAISALVSTPLALYPIHAPSARCRSLPSVPAPVARPCPAPAGPLLRRSGPCFPLPRRDPLLLPLPAPPSTPLGPYPAGMHCCALCGLRARPAPAARRRLLLGRRRVLRARGLCSV